MANTNISGLKSIGQEITWLSDYQMDRDNQGRWTVSQSYRTDDITWRPPYYPYLAIAPRVPLYDYEVQSDKGYYIFKNIWKYADNADVAQGDLTGKQLDTYANANSFQISVGVEQLAVESHPKFDAFASAIQDFKTAYDYITSGKLKFDLSQGILHRVNLQDGSLSLDEYKALYEAVNNNLDDFMIYTTIRNKGITGYLSPVRSYTTTYTDDVPYDVTNNKYLSAFATSTDYRETSKTIGIDVDNNTVTTTTYNEQ